MTNTLTQSTLAPRAQLFTLALAALIAPTTTAFAVGTDYINDAGALMVPVDDAGNQANTDGHGGVPYGYSIGKYEVTNAQYAKFLNAVDPTGANSLALYTYGGITFDSGANEGSKYTVRAGTDSGGVGWADMPVTYVSFWSAARFCNWLTNGGGTATGGNADDIAASSAALTETGVYTLTSDGMTNNTVSRNVSVSEAGALTGTGDLSGKSGTVYAVSSEDEWYKAAYYSPNQGGQGVAGYWLYPTQSDSISKSDANYENYTGVSVELKAVGSYEEKGSYYGTFDQGGNVWEWNDTTINNNYRGLRGGSCDNAGGYLASAARRSDVYPVTAYDDYGFRVSSLLITSVPEPGTYGILGGAAALLGAVALRRRPRRD